MHARWHVPSASATPWDGRDDSSLTPARRFATESQRDAYDRTRLPGPYDAAFFNGHARGECPPCKPGAIRRDGHDARGVQRCPCHACGQWLSPLAGTVLDASFPTAFDGACHAPRRLLPMPRPGPIPPGAVGWVAGPLTPAGGLVRPGMRPIGLCTFQSAP